MPVFSISNKATNNALQPRPPNAEYFKKSAQSLRIIYCPQAKCIPYKSPAVTTAITTLGSIEQCIRNIYTIFK